jgi:hypothetical protein
LNTLIVWKNNLWTLWLHIFKMDSWIHTNYHIFVNFICFVLDVFSIVNKYIIYLFNLQKLLESFFFSTRVGNINFWNFRIYQNFLFEIIKFYWYYLLINHWFTHTRYIIVQKLKWKKWVKLSHFIISLYYNLIWIILS